ncbi:hypothetical protein FHW96_004899 [Novosphingobium sp. SG751A]|uniref:uracil-DNA glycosylase family protein n=1 Tax=Novosphingobium sp. SG751A TaxID=2587000 RepID=UPI001551AF49|nr:uracil-DNA glycosylase family protein [Novosphingobium sp. SG751A]NOW48709.1 hypothetical protein [Novosphingobium sp. SG751A]
MNTPASDLEERIRLAYEASGNDLGWRFLYSPASVLNGADVAFVGLNPGGSEPQPAIFSTDAGSAYCCESWAGAESGKSPLQKQVQAIFARLGVAPENVLAGNFIPFRSRDWRSLKQPVQSLEFGREIWRDVLSTARPRVVITMAGLVTKEMAAILGIKAIQKLPIGWGSVSASRGEANGVTLIGLPHLSRYRVMGRPESQASVDRLFEGLWAQGVTAKQA